MTELKVDVWSALVAAARAYADFVAAREAMNAARPTISTTPAEYALYDERYKVDHAAEREHFRTAIRLAQVAEQIVAAQVEDAPAAPPKPDTGDLVARLREDANKLTKDGWITTGFRVGLAADLIERMAGVDHG